MSSIDDLLLNTRAYEELFHQWEKDPTSVDPSWGALFQDVDKKFKINQDSPSVKPELMPPEHMSDNEIKIEEGRGLKIAGLINGWRVWGHLVASFNPISLSAKEKVSELEPEFYGFKEKDLKEYFPTFGLISEKVAPLETILAKLKKIYGSRIGFEFKGFISPEVETWFEKRVEAASFLSPPSIEHKQMILQELAKSELFENFIHTKFTGQKRFSLEGCETLIPMLKYGIEVFTENGVEELVIGMAHRGRLNVLCNILNKSFKQVFSEFDESFLPEGFLGSGDVKYHKGFESEVVSVKSKKITITLSPNPSHLESVNPVIEGQVKGKQILKGGFNEKDKVLALLIHGDAALAGQGVVYETMQMQALRGYGTGGTLHVVLNNQVGFTTNPEEGRSTRYCTDIAKAFGCPVIHVNAEDPESCLEAIKLASEFRQTFKKDIFIELNGWRKYGHNESDEPAFTQPVLYKKIKKKESIRELYQNQLIQAGMIEKLMADSIEREYKRALLDSKESLPVSVEEPEFIPWIEEVKRPLEVLTGVSKTDLKAIAEKLFKLPGSVNLHPKVKSLYEERYQSIIEDKRIDWSTAEAMAFATLLYQGKTIRVAGQDVERGTFSQRHAVIIDQETNAKYCPFQNLKDDQGKFYIYNSLLSEMAAVGYEYGYSLSIPRGLTIWEAQYGDFANGAQVIVDQYISSCEQKWGVKSRLTLLLPHGYEGQGPEHSSARIERFLSLAGHNNFRICYPSMPHQFFHLLRRETLTSDPRPLVVFTPKGLLRLPACTSSLEELENKEFQEVIDDPSGPRHPKKLVFCTGKVYFELKAYAAKIKDETVAFVRIEELYPLYIDPIAEIFKKYEGVKEIYWVQEEPKNMGAWYYISTHLEEISGKKIGYIGREISAATATGIYLFHKKELRRMMEAVFAKETPTTYEIAGQMRV